MRNGPREFRGMEALNCTTTAPLAVTDLESQTIPALNVGPARYEVAMPPNPPPSPPMTDEEALAEARRRWGPDAWIRRPGESPYPGHSTYDVGETHPRHGRVFRGGSKRGWAEAFRDADRADRELEEARERGRAWERENPPK